MDLGHLLLSQLCLFISFSPALHLSILLFSQVTSSSAFLSLSRLFSLSLLLLHNVQLYLLQLRFLIFPMRQSARANQERRGAGRDNLFNLPVCTATLTQSPHQLIWCRAFFTCTTKTVFKAHVCVCVRVCTPLWLVGLRSLHLCLRSVTSSMSVCFSVGVALPLLAAQC